MVNVGAGTGSYEPAGAPVVAVEPSLEMIRQRSGPVPVVRAAAERLPFPDATFDVSLATLTVHHWADFRAGLTEMLRVASKQVILLGDRVLGRGFWLTDYFPEMFDLPHELHAPTVDQVAEVLGEITVEVVPIPGDCIDGFGCAYWNRPEAYLDPAVRAGSSSFVQLDAEVVRRGLRRLAEDLRAGRWDARYGRIRSEASRDLGYRLVVSR